jgi:uncharacterized protein YidB (DUF937 family)
VISIGVAVLALAGVGAAVTVAQEGDANPTFLDRLASKLGIDRDELEEAIDSAAAEEIDEAVAEGHLSEQRAERLKERLAETEGLGFFAFGHRGGHFPPGKGHLGFAFGFRALHDDLAGFLGITVEQLRDELSEPDTSLADVAEAHGKSREELRDFILDQLAPRLDEFLAENDVAPQRAERLRQRLEAFVDRLLDADHFPGKPFPAMPEGVIPPLAPLSPELFRS